MVGFGTFAEAVAVLVGLVTLAAGIKSFYSGTIRQRIVNEREQRERQEGVESKISEIYGVVKRLEEQQDELCDDQRELKEAVYYLTLSHRDRVDNPDPEQVRDVLGLDEGLSKFSEDAFPYDD